VNSTTVDDYLLDLASRKDFWQDASILESDIDLWVVNHERNYESWSISLLTTGDLWAVEWIVVEPGRITRDGWNQLLPSVLVLWFDRFYNLVDNKNVSLTTLFCYCTTLVNSQVTTFRDFSNRSNDLTNEVEIDNKTEGES